MGLASYRSVIIPFALLVLSGEVYAVSLTLTFRRRNGEQWVGFESTFDECKVVLEPLTKNTFILVVSVDPIIGERAGERAPSSRSRLTRPFARHLAHLPGFSASVDSMTVQLADHDSCRGRNAAISYSRITIALFRVCSEIDSGPEMRVSPSPVFHPSAATHSHLPEWGTEMNFLQCELC